MTEPAPDFSKLRAEMVQTQLVARGIKDEAVLTAMGEVPREEFVPPDLVHYAYEDGPASLPHGQTISQPYMVAYMCTSLGLRASDKVLEVGTGSGYGAAVLSRLAKRVITIERIAPLAETARERLHRLGYDNVEVVTGDGTLGWPPAAPYDAIVVTASGPDIPPPLKEQLAIGGRLVLPVQLPASGERLVHLLRTGADAYEETTLQPVRFVPLIGAHGWAW